MKSVDCNQIKIFINLEIIGEEDKYKKTIFIFKKNCKKFMQFSAATWRNHELYANFFFFLINQYEQ